MLSTNFMRRFANKLKSFRRDQRGNVAVIVGAAIIPLVGALGLATDTARGYLVKARLSQALDAAALAGGKVYFSTSRDDDIKKFFNVNFPAAALPSFDTPYEAQFMEAEVTLDEPVEGGTPGKENLTLTAHATIPTTFMRVLGFEDVTVHATSQVTRALSALDVVISLDMSGSMGSPGTKITAARDAAVTFVDTVFGTNSTAPTITVDGTTYNLLNMGFVPWNAKTRVTTQGATNTTVTTSSVAPFTNPVTGQTQSVLYYSGLSQVPLLMNPTDLPGGWSGCIYARYLGDAYNDNDADIVRGQVTLGSGAGQRQWMGWEPMAIDDSEARSGNWYNSSYSNSFNNGPSGTRWVNTGSTGNTWRNRQCNGAYFADNGTTNFDNADGSIKSSPSPYSSTNTSRPAAVPNPKAATASNYTEWNTNNNSSTTKKYSGFMRFIDPTTSYNKPGTTATRDSNPGTTDCTVCPVRGIIPMTNVKATIRNQLTGIAATDPNGNTNIQQGLYWGWEVLMPGVPFDQGVVSTPFQRIRAIILLTDGEQVGGIGDAYKARFGIGEGAGQNNDGAHGQISIKQVDTANHNTPMSGPNVNVQNNLDNRLRKLADNVKAEGIKLYVIGFDLENNPTALNLLNEIASDPDELGEYFFNAPNPSDLEAVFKQIAASLTTLRLSM